MAFTHGKNVRLVLNDVQFTARVNATTMQWSRDLSEATVYGEDGHRFTAGLLSGTATIGGYFDAVGCDAIRAAHGVTDAAVLTAAPTGYAHGAPVYMVRGNVSAHTADTTVTETVPFSADVQSSDGPDWGASLHDLAAETTSDDSANLDNTDATTGGGTAVLQVTAVEGDTPTLDVIVQHSVDGSTWLDLATFAQTTEPGAQVLAIADETSVARYVRASWTVDGDDPSFTFTVAFARR